MISSPKLKEDLLIMRKVSLLLVSLFGIFLLVACGSNDNNGNSSEAPNGDESNNSESTNNDDGLLAKLQEEGKIVVGFANEEPYGHLDENGELTGASVDTAKAEIGRASCREGE